MSLDCTYILVFSKRSSLTGGETAHTQAYEETIVVHTQPHEETIAGTNSRAHLTVRNPRTEKSDGSLTASDTCWYLSYSSNSDVASLRHLPVGDRMQSCCTSLSSTKHVSEASCY